MIPFKLFYPLYVRYFMTYIILTIPCGILLDFLDAIYKVNVYIALLSTILIILLFILCYKWILRETLLDKYKKIIVKTKFENIPWKFILYSFCIEATISILTGIVFDSLPILIALVAYIIIDYFIINLWLEKYAKLEISVNDKKNNDDEEIY